MASHPLRIVVGITGGIAAYKAVSVVRAFVKDGHHVDVIATEAALEFVGRPTLEAMSRNPVHVGLYDDVAQVRHVALGQQADAVVVAPATANTLASIAAGLAPDLLGNTILARRGPLVVAPAMHTEMWENPATVANIATLRARGVVVVGPGVGALTGDDAGAGRMSEPDEIVATVYATVSAVQRDFAGKRVLVTGGGTHEPLDPVRFLGNKSTGHMAVALAQAALSRGAKVTFIAGNVSAQIPGGVDVIPVETALQMHERVMGLAGVQDVVIMAAAVADYRPESPSGTKIKKNSTNDTLDVRFVRNPDILADVSSADLGATIVGFAAETASSEAELISLATSKLATKGCDFLVANRVGDNLGFGAGETSVVILKAGGSIIDTVEGSKLSVANRILDAIN